MAATTINSFSAELTQVQPPNYSPIKTNQQAGRVRTFNFTRVFASEASGQNIALATIPKGARILGGEICVSATMGSCTFALGIAAKDGTGVIDASATSDSTNFFLAAVALTTTAQTPFAITQALNYLYETQKEVYLTLTLGAASAGTQTLMGSIRYVVD